MEDLSRDPGSVAVPSITGLIRGVSFYGSATNHLEPGFVSVGLSQQKFQNMQSLSKRPS